MRIQSTLNRFPLVSFTDFCIMWNIKTTVVSFVSLFYFFSFEIPAKKVVYHIDVT